MLWSLLDTEKFQNLQITDAKINMKCQVMES